MFLKIATLTLIPVLLIQGYRVKKNTLRLAEPEGNRQGYIGVGKPLSILILGDSAAAGVGVMTQEDALLGVVLNQLKNHYQIHYRLEATTGHNSVDLLKAIQNMPNQHFDVVITSIGVNDIIQLTSARHWIKLQQKIYQQIDQKYSPCMIIASGVPPMNMFPTLPNPLAWLFGQYAKAMNQALAKFVAKHPKMHWIEYDIVSFQRLNLQMAQDGFHPSKEIYALWGKQLVAKIRPIF